MRLMMVGILVTAVLAGCVDEKPSDEPGDPDLGAQYEDPEQNFTLLQPDALPRDPPAPGERTFDEAPLWRLGEWWEYDLTAYLTGEEETIKRIVAGSEHDYFLVGFPIDQFSNFALVLHHPAYGDIHRDHISYDTHDVDFKPMDFPLYEGKTWETKWQSNNTVWTATVTSVDNETGEARIDFTTSGQNIFGQSTTNQQGYAIYDRDMGVAKLLEFPGYARAEVIDHGFNYTGDVRVPHDHDLVFFHGCLAGVQTLSPGSSLTDPDTSGCPNGQITMPDGYDRVSFGLLAQDLPGAFAAGSGQNVQTGTYSMTVTAPDGTQYSYTTTPADQQWFSGTFHEHEDPAGTWEYEAVAAGPGVIFIEGIGYHSIDISLPSGCVIASENALHHVTLCKAD